MNVPTMNLYRDGEVVKQIVGTELKAAILHDLAGYL
jgi:thioredoxin 1